MKTFRLNLQLFAEGGAAAGADGGGAEGSAAVSGVAAPDSGLGNDRSNVIYGKPSKSVAGSTQENTVKTPEILHQEFEDMIKGEYKEEYSKRVQKTVEDRLKNSKQMEATLRSQQGIMARLAEKYGADASNPEALMKAIDEDESFWQQKAMERGLSIEQYKKIASLERENEQLRQAEQENERAKNSQRIYAEWLEQAEEMQQKYGLENFSLEEEVKNEEFVRLLAGGSSVETAYKACHFDEMMGGAISFASKKAEEKVVKNIATRTSRPSENGVSPQSAVVYKTDVSKFDDKDIEELKARVRRGEKISL